MVWVEGRDLVKKAGGCSGHRTRGAEKGLGPFKAATG